MTAVISPCQKYRYVLRRALKLKDPRAYKPVLFIMLNPSTADAFTDDPTIRRCLHFTDREQGTDLTVVNLYGLRATFPMALKASDDPVGPQNDEYVRIAIEETRKDNGLIIAGWGAYTFAEAQAIHYTRKYGPFYCLGKSKNGAPRHPLYLRGAAKLVEFTL